MQTVTVAGAKARLSEILDRVEKGEEIIITRRGRPAARLSPIEPAREPIDFESLAALRARQPLSPISSAELVRKIRDEKY
jgi:prevent-host-death family protein